MYLVLEILEVRGVGVAGWGWEGKQKSNNLYSIV